MQLLPHFSLTLNGRFQMHTSPKSSPEEIPASVAATSTSPAVLPYSELEADVTMDGVSDDEGTGSIVLNYPEEDMEFGSEQVCPFFRLAK